MEEDTREDTLYDSVCMKVESRQSANSRLSTWVGVGWKGAERRFLGISVPHGGRRGMCVRDQSFQLCPTLCDPTDCSPSGSSVHGILQARILEWVPRPSSRGSSGPRDQTWVSLH